MPHERKKAQHVQSNSRLRTQAALVQAVPVRAKGRPVSRRRAKLKKRMIGGSGRSKMALQTASGTVETAGETTASVYEGFYRTLGIGFPMKRCYSLR